MLGYLLDFNWKELEASSSQFVLPTDLKYALSFDLSIANRFS